MLKMSLGLVSSAALVMMLTYGCSSDSSTTPPATDGGGGGSDSGGGKDTGKPQPDTGTPDECKPGDVADFTPSFKTPAPFSQKKCSNAQVDALLCLFDANADQETCTKLVDDPANDDCFKCIYTASSSKELGPVIITGSLGSLNIAGCVARAEGDVTDKGCGAKVQAADQCGDEACDANCPVPENDDAALDARNKCTEDASTTVCQEFSDAAKCAEALLQEGGAAEECAQGQDFLERANAIAKLFCAGGVSTDGGDGSTDAKADGG
jgi:hypothetical protein